MLLTCVQERANRQLEALEKYQIEIDEMLMETVRQVNCFRCESTVSISPSSFSHFFQTTTNVAISLIEKTSANAPCSLISFTENVNLKVNQLENVLRNYFYILSSALENVNYLNFVSLSLS